MQSERGAPFLTSKDVSRIETFCNIAKMKNAPISLAELLSLASLDLSEDEFARAWQDCDFLNRRYALTPTGLIREKKVSENEVEKERSERVERAMSNVSWAKRFRDFLNDDQLRTLAISGSTSYSSVSKDDDLDLFYVARKDRMWIGFTRALIRARLFRLKEKNSPWICLSYVADEDFIEREIANNRNPIIARDALCAKVIQGDPFFDELLVKNGWMTEYFPTLYEQRAGHPDSFRKIILPRDRNRFLILGDKLANNFFFYTVGTYIRFKSRLLNRKLKKRGSTYAVFKLRIGKSHCIYESLSYQEMKKLYSRFEE